MRLFGGENFKQLMSKAGMKPGEPIYHPLLNKSIESAQKKVEQRNFEIRKHLLEYDDVLNKQRNFIYEQRNSILSDNNLIERVREAADEMLEYQSELLAQASRTTPAKAIPDSVPGFLILSVSDLPAKQAAELYQSGNLTQEVQRITQSRPRHKN
jgi:preprotein translocase subunit SecA